MKKKVVFGIVILVLLSVPVAFAQNITFNGYWELPDGNILLIKERLYFFTEANGKLNGATGSFSYTNNRVNFHHPDVGTIPFSYTVIDSGSIRVTDTGGNNAWAHGIWKKRTNIKGTAINHRIIGYWEGRAGDKIQILYIAGNDIMPAQDLEWFDKSTAGILVTPDGWAYDFDHQNNLVSISDLYFSDGNWIMLGNPPGYDGVGQKYRFDGSALLVNYSSYHWTDEPWKTNDEVVRFVKK
jgi:hypothetical protein